MRATRLVAWLAAPLAVAVGAALLAVTACNNTKVPVSEGDDAPDPELTGLPYFKDVTADSKVKFTYRNGEEAKHYAIIESLGGGLALIDYDGDGLLDIFLPGGGYFDRTHEEFQKNKNQVPGIHGHPCKLYKNLGKFQFQDVTAEVGLDRGPVFYSHGVAVADFNRDGWPDLLVTGWGRMALYRNDPVDPKDPKKGRKFTEVSKEMGLPEGLWTTSAAWADLDGDGFPDLYVCQYVDWDFAKKHPVDCKYDGKTRDVCPPKTFYGIPHHVFLNKGGKGFVDVSLDAGLRMPRTEEEFEKFAKRVHEQLPEKTKEDRKYHDRWLERLRNAEKDKDNRYGKGLGVIAVDINGDGKPDLYVANDTVDNFLYVNRGRNKGQLLLEELGMESGTARDDSGSPNGSMGLAAGDPAGLGRPDIWVTNYEHELHALYRNQCRPGHEFFLYATKTAGLAVLGQAFVGWGTGFLDLDHHGWEDLVVSNGHAIRHPTGKAARLQKPVLLRNVGQGRFKDITPRGGTYFGNVHLGRGLVLGDLDNDGRVDLAFSPTNEPVAILQNVADTKDNHWLGIDLAGKDHRDVVGARIVVEAGGRKWTRFAQGGGSYASSGDRRHVIGLGKLDKVDKVTVYWPWGGETQTWAGSDLTADRYWRLVEGEKKAQEPVRR